MSLERKRLMMAYTWMEFAGIAKNNLGLYNQAVAWCRRAIEANRNHPNGDILILLAASLLGAAWPLDEALLRSRALASRSTVLSPFPRLRRLDGDER